MRVQPEPCGWDHPCVLWQSRDDPEGEPLFALEDTVEGEHWDTFEQYRQLAERSLRMALSVVADDLPGVAQVHAFFSYVVLSFSKFSIRLINESQGLRLSQNRPIYKNTSTMAIRKQLHCYT